MKIHAKFMKIHYQNSSAGLGSSIGALRRVCVTRPGHSGAVRGISAASEEFEEASPGAPGGRVEGMRFCD
jgi:hypothetical protein